MISRSSPGRFWWTSWSKRANFASISPTTAGLDPARCPAALSGAGAGALPAAAPGSGSDSGSDSGSGWGSLVSTERANDGGGATGGRAVPSSMPMSVLLAPELVPSSAEGTALSRFPEAAGGFAIANYRSHGKSTRELHAGEAVSCSFWGRARSDIDFAPAGLGSRGRTDERRANRCSQADELSKGAGGEVADPQVAACIHGDGKGFDKAGVQPQAGGGREHSARRGRGRSAGKLSESGTQVGRTPVTCDPDVARGVDRDSLRVIDAAAGVGAVGEYDAGAGDLADAIAVIIGDPQVAKLVDGKI